MSWILWQHLQDIMPTLGYWKTRGVYTSFLIGTWILERMSNFFMMIHIGTKSVVFSGDRCRPMGPKGHLRTLNMKFLEKMYLTKHRGLNDEVLYMLCLCSLSQRCQILDDIIISVYTIFIICISASSANKIATELCRRGIRWCTVWTWRWFVYM